MRALGAADRESFSLREKRFSSHFIPAESTEKSQRGPMMDWSDGVNSEKNLNHLGYRQKSCPHFVTTIRYSAATRH